MSERPPDLEIAARVRADELRFECVPQTRVTAHADVRASAAVESRREHLPDAVEPNVTYRDIEVGWRAWLRL